MWPREAPGSRLTVGGDGQRGARLFAVAFAVIVGLALIAFVYYASRMQESGLWLGVVFILSLLFGSAGGSFLVAYRSGERDSGRGVPRGAIKLLVLGLSVVGVGFAVFFLWMAFPAGVQRPVELPYVFIGLIAVGMGIAFGGRLYSEAILDARKLKVPSSMLKSLRQIEPDSYFEAEKFHVFRKGSIFILLKKRLLGVHFIRLFRWISVSDAKVEIPFFKRRRYRVRYFEEEVNGLHFAMSKREFTLPVGIVRVGASMKINYVRGSGIQYYVSMYPMGRFLVNLDEKSLCRRLDTPTIISILNRLLEEKATDVFK